MFKPLITRVLNHLINQNEWARAQLQRYSGHSIRFVIPPAGMTLTVLEDGGLAAAGEAALVSARVTIPLPAAMRLLSGDANAQTLATIDGDTELAAVMGRVLRNMSWEFEEDLSQLIGDIPAHQLAEFGRRTVSEVRRQAVNVAEMFAEYWQEEQPMIAKKRHVRQFMQDVEDLRDDLERLEKRLDRLGKESAPTPAAEKDQ